MRDENPWWRPASHAAKIEAHDAGARRRRAAIFAALAAALAAVVLLAGCHNLTDAERTEVKDGYAAGDNLLKNWDRKDDATKKAYVFRFTRICGNVVWTVEGTPPDAAYVDSRLSGK